MTIDKYMIVRHDKQIPEQTPAVVQSERTAIEEAKKLAVLTGEPHDVYGLVHIGCSSAPASNFIDYRPQTADAPAQRT